MKNSVKLKLVFAALGILLWQNLKAQTEEIYFKKSEPERVKLIIQAKLFDLECSALDPMRIGVGLAGDYMMSSLLSFHADMNTSLFQVSTSSAQIFNTNLNPIAEYTKAEGCVRLQLMDKIGTQKIKIYQSSEVHGDIRTTHYLEIPYPARKIFGLRGGLYTSVEPVNTDENLLNSPSKDKKEVQSTHGKLWGSAGVPVYTNMNIFGFYGGLSFISIVNATYSYSEDGSYGRLKRWFRETYLDVMYAPAVSFGDIKTSGGTSKIVGNDPGSFKISNLGGRIGQTIITPKNFGTAFSIEAGYRPGIMGTGYYFGGKFSLVFCNKNHDFRVKTKK